MQRGWRKIFEMGGSKESCATLTHLFKRCEDSEIKTFEDAKALATWVSAAVVNIAMGSFPYPSAYLLNGKGMLPAYPVAAACRFVEGERTDMEIVEGLMTGLTQMYYNNTGDKTCFSTKDTGAFSGSAWDYLACSEVILASAQDGIRDMFWNAPFDREAMRKDCLEQYGSHTKFDVGSIKYGGRKAMRATSNVIFTNGELDPWIAEGVLQDVTDTVVSIIIPKAGHHEDLMFSTKDDPPALTDARERILVHIRRWIDEVTEAYEEPFISTNIAKKMWIWDKEEI
ncbi:hypothetical protein SARC_03403 [Sphaeroforma arctica JP610]|uniref:Lysosomal Pro-X carboxypeptidase n=1 Tax=Sphaeroforma arctica JP610 TaxID=667725 RepID=A0A0L0G7Y8_9EUKA|nr:hypothetical protein SARC_03403 [Sphaeroforma arctica JP610]KNC84358.1 hypothetical protein SARC_03403 [Sphaeroforma arctica JP610]|eukprot:XP_014158260.1 hypothetical protein SARC_03403 [Sphaeroforma arctica JP610]